MTDHLPLAHEAADRPVPRWQPFTWTHAPVGGLVRLGYLLAGIALENAHHARATRTPGPIDSQARAAAEQRLTSPNATATAFTVCAALTDALVWHTESAVARAALPPLVEHYRVEYGVLIDTETPSIALDPDFDDDAKQHTRQTWRADQRATRMWQAAAQLLDGAGETSAAALHATQSGVHDQQLTEALAAAGVSETVCEVLLYVDAYLFDYTAGIDLEVSPLPLVDLAEEAKSVVQSSLDRLQKPSEETVSAPIPEELRLEPGFRLAYSVLSPPDRARVDAALEAFSDDGAPPALWPHHLDRNRADELLVRYRDRSQSVQSYAARLPAVVDDAEHHARITGYVSELAEIADVLLDAARHGRGLIGIERELLIQTMAGAEISVRTPRLRFVGELFLFAQEMREHQEAATELMTDYSTELASAVYEAFAEGDDEYREHSAPDSVHEPLLEAFYQLADRPDITGYAHQRHRAALARWDEWMAGQGHSALVRQQARASIAGYVEEAIGQADMLARSHRFWTSRFEQFTSRHQPGNTPAPANAEPGDQTHADTTESHARVTGEIAHHFGSYRPPRP
ncbi:MULTISPECIES: hypothetical protein [Nocardia]|uniref:hypothetical protein n=1 Tax=Nocardia TaxID=1817 RepID=UPI000D688062|nr:MULTISPECIES: hypothetical protein [Nocardia]